MTDKEFREKVREMRAAQKEYFRKKDQAVLRYCKRLEKEIDRELEPVKEETRPVNQFSMF